MFTLTYISRTTFLILLIATICNAEEYKKKSADEKVFITALERKLEFKFAEYTTVVTKWLEGFNDKYLAKSEFGRWLHYEQIKPKLTENRIKSRNLKKTSMTLLPLVFHIGAASTWMIFTALMAAKSVGIGMLLLIFKIAASSAKLSSFFATWKEKKDHHDHSWTPHYEHYGHERSFSDNNDYNNNNDGNENHHEHQNDHHEHNLEHYGPHEHDWQSYHTDWKPSELSPHELKTIPSSYGVDEPCTDFDSSKTRIG